MGSRIFECIEHTCYHSVDLFVSDGLPTGEIEAAAGNLFCYREVGVQEQTHTAVNRLLVHA